MRLEVVPSPEPGFGVDDPRRLHAAGELTSVCMGFSKGAQKRGNCCTGQGRYLVSARRISPEVHGQSVPYEDVM